MSQHKTGRTWTPDPQPVSQRQRHIAAVVRECDGDYERAAKRLGLSVQWVRAAVRMAGA